MILTIMNKVFIYDQALRKLTNEIPQKLKEKNFEAGMYVGKTDNVNERLKDHETKRDYVYLTPVAHGKPSLISRLEHDIIVELSKAGIKLLNKRPVSSGNKEADILYVCFDSCLPCDELCEYDTFDFGKDYPIEVVDN